MERNGEKEIPIWVRIPVGAVLGLFTLLCAAGSITLLVAPPEKEPLFGFVVGVILLLGCMWVLEKCVRMLLGLRNKGGLISPRALRGVSVVFLLLPLAGFFTGYFSDKGLVAIAQAIGDLAIFIGLNLLARSRWLK